MCKCADVQRIKSKRQKAKNQGQKAKKRSTPNGHRSSFIGQLKKEPNNKTNADAALCAFGPQLK
jgi:hypothetical protein